MPNSWSEPSEKCTLKTTIETMNAREFFYLVANMRTAQKRYLSTKDRAVFRAARKLENEVDAEINRVKMIIEEQNQENAVT